jgi:hypothetical protein
MILRGKSCHCQFVHHKHYMLWPGSNPALRCKRPETNGLNQATIKLGSYSPKIKHDGCAVPLRPDWSLNVLMHSTSTRRQTDSLYFGFPNALDTVPHFLLLKKLSTFSPSPNYVNWLQRYLTCRHTSAPLAGVIYLPIHTP